MKGQSCARPKKVRIAPFRYTVQVVDTLGEDSGLSSSDMVSISIASGMEKLAERDTLLHESLHMCLMQNGMKPKLEGFEKGLEEQIVAALTPRLLSLLRDNPKFLVWLTS